MYTRYACCINWKRWGMKRREEWSFHRQKFQDELDEFNALLDAMDLEEDNYVSRDYFLADVQVRESFRKYTNSMKRLFGSKSDD